MNELSKVVNAQLQQAAENLVRNRLMSDEFLDFVQENTKPLDTLMAYYKCAIMEVETKFKVLNEQFSLEYDRNPIESIKTRVKSLDGIVRKVRRKNIPLTLSAIEQNINDIAGIRVVCSFPEDIYLLADCLLQQDDIRLIEQKELGLNPADVQGLYLNIRYDGTHLTCVTGTSFKSFMMDKTLEREWDEMVKKFFLKKEIEFELM